MATKILQDVRDYPTAVGKRSALCIGNFDGVHPGHEYLIKKLIEAAKTQDIVSAVLTFEPHPLDILGQKGTLKRLTNGDYKIRLLQKTGVDVIIVQKFTRRFASVKPMDFMEKIVVEQLQAKVIVIGPDFKFGFGRGGDRNILEEFGKQRGIEIVSVEMLEKNGRLISSSHIRKLLLHEGDVADVFSILGRPYGLEGRVVRGGGRGRRLGFPTANLSDIDVLIPKEGIYAGAGFADKKMYPAAIHIGERKTFSEPFAVEIYFIGRQNDSPLYGELVRAYLLQRLRDVMRFDDPDALKNKIREDIDDTLEIYNKVMGKLKFPCLEV